MRKAIALTLWIIIFQVIGYVIGLLTQLNIAHWYQGLHKSAITPPNLVFPIVWGCLYIVLAIIGWSLWENRRGYKGTLIFNLYLIQMIMNWAWTPLFFQFHLIATGFYWILAMLALAIGITIMLKEKNRLAYYLFIPYCIWLLFAAYLNLVIVIKN